MAKKYNEKLSYEVFPNGYDIYDYGHPWIEQRGASAKLYIPDGTYEENAVAHCEELTATTPAPEPTAEEKLRADVDYLALMTDVVLPSQEEEGE